MKESDYTKETLLDVIASYRLMIKRSGAEFPTVVLGDIYASSGAVLQANNYHGFYESVV